MEKKIVSDVIDDGVRIITYEDGSQRFEAIEQPKPAIQEDNRSWWQKLKDWWNDAPITPYVKVRDLADPFGDRRNDPFDIDAGSDGKNAAEIGIRIKF